MEDILNKNIIRFSVAGALDFTEDITIEIYGKKEDGTEEISVNDITSMFHKLYPVISPYFEWQVRLVATDHHFNINPRKIWVKCIRYYHHSHDWFKEGTKNILKLDTVIKELKDEHNYYSLDYHIGYDFKAHVEQLKQYFKSDVLVQIPGMETKNNN